MIERTNSIVDAHFTIHISSHSLQNLFWSIVASLCMPTRRVSHFHQDLSMLNHFFVYPERLIQEKCMI